MVGPGEPDGDGGVVVVVDRTLPARGACFDALHSATQDAFSGRAASAGERPAGEPEGAHDNAGYEPAWALFGGQVLSEHPRKP